MREKSIECTDCRAHESNFALAPPFIPAQHAQRTRVLALAASNQDQLRERRRVQQPQVDTLAGERMNNMSRIADERTAVRNISMCSESLKR
jgi:hypothetical protein